MVRDKFFILIIIFLFLLNLLTIGYLLIARRSSPEINNNEYMIKHDGDPEFRDKRIPGKPDKIIEMLKFNEDQQKQFEELKKQNRMQVENLQDSSRILHDEYFGLLKPENYSRQKADSLLEQISANQKALDRVTFEHFEKIKNLCNPEQKKQFILLINEIAHSLKLPPPKR